MVVSVVKQTQYSFLYKQNIPVLCRRNGMYIPI